MPPMRAPPKQPLPSSSLSDEKIDNLLTKFEKEDYWNTFLLYDWFHSVIWDEA